MSDKIYRLIRVLEYYGPRGWIDEQIRTRSVKQGMHFEQKGNGLYTPRGINESFLGEVPIYIPTQEPIPSDR